MDSTVADKIRLRNDPDSKDIPKNYLLLCEHPPVYTLGKSGMMENLFFSEKELKVSYDLNKFLDRGHSTSYNPPNLTLQVEGPYTVRR